ncbi:MAG: iron-sulfur cluster assembly accessory protein [Phycisphaerae bacterium]
MSITLSEIAAAEIKKILKDQGMGEKAVLRVGIKGRNAQGFNYLLDLTEVRHENDIVGQSHNIPIMVDPVSFPSLDGTEIDFRDDAAGRGFVFKNPHAVKLPVNTGGAGTDTAGTASTAGGDGPTSTIITDALANKTLEAAIVEKLRTIFDPEIPVNIYDLGLIYRIDISAQKEVTVDMTLTAPGCPVAGSMPPAVQQAVESVEDVKTAKVNLVWEPAWSKDRMSDAALLQLGLL